MQLLVTNYRVYTSLPQRSFFTACALVPFSHSCSNYSLVIVCVSVRCHICGATALSPLLAKATFNNMLIDTFRYDVGGRRVLMEEVDQEGETNRAESVEVMSGVARRLKRPEASAVPCPFSRGHHL